MAKTAKSQLESPLPENEESTVRKALDELSQSVYIKLKRVAANQMRSRPGHTLSPTSLVHEVFMRLNKSEDIRVRDPSHFFALAAQCMRWILLDYAKQKRVLKRGGNPIRVTLQEYQHVDRGEEVDIEALNEALERLSKQDERLSRIVELRYLVGLSIEQTAEVLKISTGTVKRDWNLAKAWLKRELSQGKAEEG